MVGISVGNFHACVHSKFKNTPNVMASIKKGYSKFWNPLGP